MGKTSSDKFKSVNDLALEWIRDDFAHGRIDAEEMERRIAIIVPFPEAPSQVKAKPVRKDQKKPGFFANAFAIVIMASIVWLFISNLGVFLGLAIIVAILHALSRG